MMELVFSFILNTWSDLAEVNSWASEHLGGVHNLVGKIKKEGQILCALEHNRLLVYDSKWKKQELLEIPTKCHGGALESISLISVQEIEFRSETLSSTPKHSAWDQKVDIKMKGHPSFSLYIRQDKKYVGAHSTAGWSMWIERKTGHLRFEYMDLTDEVHFRAKAQGDINPVKGGLTSVHSVCALYVAKDKGKLHKASILTGKKSEGLSHVNFQKIGEEWKKILHKCEGAKSCKDLDVATDEEKLSLFADIRSERYLDFVEKGRPLAFEKISPEELVPPMAIFR